MTEQTAFPVVDMLEKYRPGNGPKEDVLIKDLNYSGVYPQAPCMFKEIIIAIFTGGSCRMQIDDVAYDVRRGDILFILPGHVLRLLEQESDISGRMLVTSIDFVQRADIKLSAVHYLLLKKYPHFSMEGDHMKSAENFYSTIAQRIEDRDHLFRTEILQGFVSTFFYELGNVVIKRYGSAEPEISSGERIVERFLILLGDHLPAEHSVVFYADQLFITPQYLSSRLKKATGITTSQWIDRALVQNAKIMLSSSDLTVQQVALELNFPDQSTFGKFFKKHTGMSPLAYRQSENL